MSEEKFLAHGVFAILLAVLVALPGALVGCGDDDGGLSRGTGRSESGDGDGDGDEAQSCDELECGKHAECREALESAACECEDGYELDDDECVDIDECDDDSRNSCDKHASCKNEDGDYSCECDDGYMGDGFSCAPEDADAGEGPCPSGQIGEDEDSCYCDLSGYWAVRQDVTFTVPEQELDSTTVFIEETVTKSTLWELHRYDYDGSVIKVQTKGCGTDNYPRISSPFFEETYTAGVPFEVFDKLDLEEGEDVPLDSEDAQPGGSFETPSQAALIGIKMDDPLNDPWPETRYDVDEGDWVDYEGDGQPGLSLWSGELNCPMSNRPDYKETICYTPVEQEGDTAIVRRRASCVSVATRVITRGELKLATCSRITGDLINEKTEGRVHSCLQVDESDWGEAIRCDRDAWLEGRACTDEQVDNLDLQDQSQDTQATLEAVKLAGLDADDVDCDMVRERLPAIER